MNHDSLIKYPRTHHLQGSRLQPGEVRPANVELLMRNIGLVTSIGAESLDVVDHVVLDPRAGEALWMLPTNELRTMVVHRTRLGLLDTTSTGQRFELVVTAEDLPTPLEVLVLPPFARALADFAERHQGCQ